MSYDEDSDLVEDLQNLFFQQIIRIESENDDAENRDFRAGESSIIFEADLICKKYEVPVEKRPDVIIKGFECAHHEYMKQSSAELKQVLKQNYSLGMNDTEIW